MRKLMLVAAAILLATQAQAAVKVYNGDVLPGDAIEITTTLCPIVNVTAGVVAGNYTVTDTGGGTVTLEDLNMVQDRLVNFADISAVFGPGAFIFIDVRNSAGPAPGLTFTAPGSTAPGGAVAWGIVSGWSTTGFNFCISSPGTVCDSNGFTHGATANAVSTSTTYDLGTWSFTTPTGDLEATPFVTRTQNGALANSQRVIRGALQGAALPALPLVGFGALALGLAAVGARSVMRKK